jgi:hypothetical protein
MKMRTIKLSILAVVLLVTGFQASAQQEKFRVQAMFVYNFTRMAAWPQSYQSGDFVIGVYGNSPIHKEFVDLASVRQVGSQKIEVKQFNSVDEIGKCHIIFVASNQARNIPEITQKLKSNNISALVISEARNSLADGAAVNFIMENDRPRYELNESNARSMGLNLGSEMTRLATAVK